MNIKGKNMTIYVDMDGVIADFFSEIAKTNNVAHWKEIPADSDTYEKLRGTDFFNRLPKFKTSDDLIRFVDEATNGKWCILSAPLRGDYDNSSFWKREWLNKNGYVPKEAIFTSRKEKYATNEDGTPNILVDDKLSNLDRWMKAGGVAIKYQANEDSLDGLKSKISVELGKI
tara:strand:+ start:445 stop:960 length:516 start_codon:yes stop_codon:yes gene_type:complete